MSIRYQVEFFSVLHSIFKIIEQMKNYISIIITFAVMALVIVSCSDYLDAPVNGALTQSNFYQSDEDANAAIVGAYDMLTYDLWNNTWASPVVMKSILSDCAQSGGPNADDQPGYEALDKMAHTASNDKVAALWGVSYFGVHRCNLVLDNVAEDSPFKTVVRGEAKALRAFFYMDLVSHFGNVPLLSTTNISPDSYNISNTSKDEIYTLIEQDLNEAIAVLPVKSAQSSADRFRMSKGAAQALLGKAKLNQGKHSEALQAFEQVITSGEYSLEADYSMVFRKEGEFGSGSLLEAVYADNAGLVGGTAPWGDQRLFETNMHVQLTGPRDGDFFTSPESLDFTTGWGFNLPSEKLGQTYDTYGDTYRKNITILSEADYLADGGTITGDPYDYEGYFRLKYGTVPSEQGSGDGFLNYGTNWRLLRYADVLLSAAEAAAFSGNDGAAQSYLNEVRSRAQIAASTAGGADLIKEIQDERFMELAFEGHRFQDLVRWGIAAENINGFQSGKHEVLPIPEGEIERAESLIQNIGY